MWRTRFGSVLYVACIAALAHPLLAQQPSNVSEELMSAILRYAFRWEGGNARVFQGRVPDDLAPNFYVPPGTRVLGSVVTGSAVVVLATSSTPVDSLRAVYARALAPRGWKPLEAMQRGGFVEEPARTPVIFCKEGAELHVTQSRRGGGTSDLYLNYRDGPGACERPTAVAFRQLSEPHFPTLFAPLDTTGTSRARCLSRSPAYRGSMSTRTMIPTDMPAEDVLRHYGRQVESDGWRAAGTDQPTASRTWTRADSTGMRSLTLRVRQLAPSGPRCYEIEMSVSESPR
jgi:hypothetical protein